MDKSFPYSPESLKAFGEYDREVTLSNIRIGCYLGMVLMPAGTLLDRHVYSGSPDLVEHFLQLRFLSSVLIGLFLGIVMTSWGRNHHRMLGVTLAMVPSFFIALMIYWTPEGADSSYYAGLNLVLLVVGFVLHWTFRESVVAVSLVFVMYLGACIWHAHTHGAGTAWEFLMQSRLFINNLYFLVLTGIIVVTGNYFHSRLRFREFALRFELDRSSQQLEESNRKLVQLDRLKNQFFANISHELRTPLTLMLAPLHNLIKQRERGAWEETLESLQTMQSNGLRLLKLINDLLELVRLESGKIEVRQEPLALEEFLKGMVQSVRGMADGKGVKVTLHTGPGLKVVWGDRDKLEKILLNLIFNAIKFTPAGGSVALEAERCGETWTILVRDTGMGIDPEDLPFIFDRFWQGDSSSNRKFQGTGLGLALVRELVEAQEGNVGAESALGKGTSIKVRMPYKAAPDQIVESKPAVVENEPGMSQQEWLGALYRRAEWHPFNLTTAAGSRQVEGSYQNRGKPKLLIADDEPDMLRFLRLQFQGDFTVLEAVDGEEAIEKACQFLPEVIVLDMMMPEKDGLEVCRELRHRTPTRGIPVLLLTARADEETKMAALEAGATDFLTKPFSGTELQVRLKNLVESHQLQRALTRQNQILEATLENLKEAQTQLVQSEKLASLGRLSAGIIHEINNPVNFVKTGIHYLHEKKGMMAKEELLEFEDVLKDLDEGMNRIQTIVSDLRSFTHPGEGRSERLLVADIVNVSLRFVSYELKENITVHQDVPDGLTLWGKRNQLIQIVVNLLQNSMDALKEKTFQEGGATIWIEGSEKDSKVLLVVRDNGPGVSFQNQERIFDPFFTTKDIGEGMGLGLSICYRIIQDHGGRIHLRSKAGEFCEFTLEFPAEIEEVYNSV
jgi:signal transduction histidine kinase